MSDIKYDLFRSIDFVAKSMRFQLVNYQNQVDEKIKNVTLDLNQVQQENAVIKDVLGQLFIERLAAPSKEGDFMSEIVEIKTKVNDIDATVRKMESDIAIVKTTMELKFDSITKILEEIKTTFSSFDQKVENKLNKIDSKLEKIPIIEKDIAVIKEKTDHAITNRKWMITTAIAFIGAAGTIAKLIFG